MPKFNFPMSFDSFTGALKDKKAFDVLGADIVYAFSCLRMGWMNKQYHKDKQGKDQEEMRIVKRRMAEDPELRARLLGHEQKKHVG